MDCNSIVYDAVRELVDQYHPDTSNDYESKLIKNVINHIDMYIKLICPTRSIFIAFDGVAPFAKMNQQKTRRYKSSFMAKVELTEWSTSNITPGTKFMDELSFHMDKAFNNTEAKI